LHYSSNIIIVISENQNFRKDDKMTRVIQMRQRGSITIPTDLRKRYQLDDGDPLTIVDLGDGFFISPKRSVLPKLVTEMEQLRDKYNVTLEELIAGVNDKRIEQEYSKVADR
jgi:bifunctional DNA-binding transcriptional regulator/antitoxin component of YhaV-PrlF toxin-antitoxin module